MTDLYAKLHEAVASGECPFRRTAPGGSPSGCSLVESLVGSNSTVPDCVACLRDPSARTIHAKPVARMLATETIRRFLTRPHANQAETERLFHSVVAFGGADRAALVLTESVKTGATDAPMYSLLARVLRSCGKNMAPIGIASTIQSPGRDMIEENGVKRFVLKPCRYRGEQLDFREVPCCGGKIRRVEKFACSNEVNDLGTAWANGCTTCILRKE